MDVVQALGTLGSGPVERAASVRRFRELDWDFTAEVSDSPFSPLHWHPCRFPSQLPAIVIGRLTRPGDLVLDPFVGSGTTIVEAQRLGRPGMGIDINPVSCLVSRAKTSAMPAARAQELAWSSRMALTADWDALAPAAAPEGVQADKWYTVGTLLQLERIWGWVTGHGRDPGEKLLLEAAFSSVLMSACRETRHWGYVCDNTAPRTNRERDVRALFCDALDRWAAAFATMDANAPGAPARCEVVNGDARASLRAVADHSVACFVTSPPYLGVTDYAKAQRLSMEWFGHAIEPARLGEIGARSKRHRRTAEADYDAELRATFSEVIRVLRPGGWGCIVFGRSPKRPSSERFVEDLREAGFLIELSTERQISDRRQFPSLRSEDVILVRKP